MTQVEPDADLFEVIRQVGRSWGWVFSFGVVSVILGIIMVIRPKHTTMFFAVLFGIWLLVAGLFRMVAAIADREDSGGTRWAIATLGLLSVVIGIVVLRHTYQTVAVLGFVIGIFWVIGGIAEMFAGFNHPVRGARIWLIIMGLIGLIVGILALVYPGLSLVILTFLLGIWLILYGILQMILALQYRKLRGAV